MVAALERLGVKPDDVQTRSITLNRIDYGPNRGRFQANNLIEVRVRDLKRAGEAIAATTEAGANVLSGPEPARLRPGGGEPVGLCLGLQGGAGAGGRLCGRGRAQGGAGAGDPRRGEGGGPMPYYEGDAAMGMAVETAAPPPPAVMPG